MAEIISLALHRPPRLLLTFSFLTSSPLLHKGGEFRITFNNLEQRVLLLIQGEDRRGPELTTKNTETKYIHPKKPLCSLWLKEFPAFPDPPLFPP